MTAGTEDQGGRSRPLWFGPEDQPLFGWLHAPVSGAARGGVVLCPTLGMEAVNGRYTFRCLGDFFQVREGGGDTDGAVVGILSVRMGGSRRREHDPCFLGQSNHALGAALAYLKANEIAAFWVGPGDVRNVRELLGEYVEHLVKFGCDQRSLLVHQALNACTVLEKPNMTQLIDLVRTDCPRCESCQQPLDVIF